MFYVVNTNDVLMNDATGEVFPTRRSFVAIYEKFIDVVDSFVVDIQAWQTYRTEYLSGNERLGSYFFEWLSKRYKILVEGHIRSRSHETICAWVKRYGSTKYYTSISSPRSVILIDFSWQYPKFGKHHKGCQLHHLELELALKLICAHIEFMNEISQRMVHVKNVQSRTPQCNVSDYRAAYGEFAQFCR